MSELADEFLLANPTADPTILHDRRAEKYLGQILEADGRWVDYGRGTYKDARTFWLRDPTRRRVVWWIGQEIIIPVKEG